MILGVIPARYASSRLPGKPLSVIAGKSMIRRVYEQSVKSKRLAGVVVATDDPRIYTHVNGFGGKVVITASTHISGTERVCEVAEKYPEYDHYINIQGDEPFIDPRQIDALCETLAASPEVGIATMVRQIKNPALLSKDSVMKVVIAHSGDAMYFSRSAIPYCREGSSDTEWLAATTYYKHVAIYGFRKDILLKIPGMKPSALEAAESLEQLRWLANGYAIRTVETDIESFSVDTPEDLKKAIRYAEGRD